METNIRNSILVSSNMYVENKVVLITGGASGIGLSVAKEFLKNNVKGITLADINETQGEEARKDLISEYGDKVLFVRVDVAKKDEFEDAMKRTVKRFENFDILINSAGVGNEKAWESVIDVNLKGTYIGCVLAMEEYLPKYKSSSEGLIVNLGSVLSLRGSVAITYSATKHGVLAIGKCIGTSLHFEQTKVKVITVCPGLTDTPIILNLDRKGFNERHDKILRDYVASGAALAQKVEVVSKGLVKILDVFNNGSVWVIDKGEVFEVEVPDLDNLKKLQTITI